MPDGRTAMRRFWNPRELVSLAEALSEDVPGLGGLSDYARRRTVRPAEGARRHRLLWAAVCDQFLADRPIWPMPPDGIRSKRGRLARDFTDRAGFTSSPHVVQFMFTAAAHPAFHDDGIFIRDDAWREFASANEIWPDVPISTFFTLFSALKAPI
jgi:hypothetical protein